MSTGTLDSKQGADPRSSEPDEPTPSYPPPQTESVVIRAAVAADRAFLTEQFAHAYARMPVAKGTPLSVLASLMDGMLAPPWKCAVACVASDRNTILGWVNWTNPDPATNPQIGWIFVRRYHRKHGIGAALLAETGVKAGVVEVATQGWTIDGAGTPRLLTLANQHGYELRFRPYLPLLGRPR